MRTTTDKILEMIDEGLLEARTVALACMKYMPEDAVEDIAKANEFLEDEQKGCYTCWDLDDEEPEDEEVSYDFIINVGDYDDELDPYCVAFPAKEEAIEEAKKLIETKTYKFTEVVYMPVDDEDINEVVWRSWEK